MGQTGKSVNYNSSHISHFLECIIHVLIISRSCLVWVVATWILRCIIHSLSHGGHYFLHFFITISFVLESRNREFHYAPYHIVPRFTFGHGFHSLFLPSPAPIVRTSTPSAQDRRVVCLILPPLDNRNEKRSSSLSYSAEAVGIALIETRREEVHYALSSARCRLS